MAVVACSCHMLPYSSYYLVALVISARRCIGDLRVYVSFIDFFELCMTVILVPKMLTKLYVGSLWLPSQPLNRFLLHAIP